MIPITNTEVLEWLETAGEHLQEGHIWIADVDSLEFMVYSQCIKGTLTDGQGNVLA